MKIIKKNQAVNVSKPEGTVVDYYLRDEYEIHFNEQIPGSTQSWHHHEKIIESLFVLEGELTVFWKDGDETKEELVRVGDLVETESSPHTFKNHTDKTVKFLVFKLVPSGKTKREIIKNDKVIDENES